MPELLRAVHAFAKTVNARSHLAVDFDKAREIVVEVERAQQNKMVRAARFKGMIFDVAVPDAFGNTEATKCAIRRASVTPREVLQND